MGQKNLILAHITDAFKIVFKAYVFSLHTLPTFEQYRQSAHFQGHQSGPFYTAKACFQEILPLLVDDMAPKKENITTTKQKLHLFWNAYFSQKFIYTI